MKQDDMSRNRTDLRKRHKQRTWNMFVGTWPVLSWFRPGAVKRAIQLLETYQIGVTALQKIRWPDEETVTMDEYTILTAAQRITNTNLEQILQ